MTYNSINYLMPTYHINNPCFQILAPTLIKHLTWCMAAQSQSHSNKSSHSNQAHKQQNGKKKKSVPLKIKPASV